MYFLCMRGCILDAKRLKFYKKIWNFSKEPNSVWMNCDSEVEADDVPEVARTTETQGIESKWKGLITLVMVFL